MSGPPGATVNFDPHYTNSGKRSIATFSSPGTYRLRSRVIHHYGGDSQHEFDVQVGVADTAPPIAGGATLLVNDVPRPTASLAFSEFVGWSVWHDDVQLLNITSSQAVPPEQFTVSYDAATNTARVALLGPAGGLPQAGDYRATFAAAAVYDTAGNYNSQPLTFDFTFLPGDADGDGDIDGDDFFAIDAGFTAGAAGYANGDFDYNGLIDADDYFLIDSNYNKAQLALALPARAVTGSGAELPSVLMPPISSRMSELLRELEV